MNRINKIVLLLLLQFSVSTFAQSNVEVNSLTRPILNGHKFIVNNYVKSPFVNTHLRNTLGFGQAMDLIVPIEINGEQLVGLRGDISFLTLDFAYQFQINKWLAFFSDVGMITRFGTETQSLIAQGLNASYGVELGWLFNVLTTKNVSVSLTANLWKRSGTVINLLDFVKEIIDSSGLPSESNLVYSRDYLQGGGGIRTAWAINKYFGLNTSLELAYGEAIDNVLENSLYYRFGVSGDFDFNSKYKGVPIGISAGLLLDSFTLSNDNAVDDKSVLFFIRTSYTAENDMLISLDLTWTRLPMNYAQENLNTVSSLITLEYFF